MKLITKLEIQCRDKHAKTIWLPIELLYGHGFDSSMIQSCLHIKQPSIN